VRPDASQAAVLPGPCWVEPAVSAPGIAVTVSPFTGIQNHLNGTGVAATFTVPMKAFAHWDTRAGSWVATAGSYQVLVGDSSRNLPLTGTESVPATVTVPIA
jgi:hypothetical protein